MTWANVYALTRITLKDTPSIPTMVITNCVKCGTKIVTEQCRSARCSICGMMFSPVNRITQADLEIDSYGGRWK